MAKPREFTTLPVRAIADTRLSALEIRCLAVIALHDGMSTVRGAGAGCYARSATLAALVDTDITRFSRAVSKLIKLDYLVKEPQQNDRRRFTLRVLYGDDNSWRDGQLSSDHADPEIVDEPVNHSGEMVDELVNVPTEIVDRDESGNGSFPPVSGPHYIPLNGEIDFVETSEINSVKTAQHAFGALRVDEIFPCKSSFAETKKDSAEAGCPRGASIDALLIRQVPSFPKLALRNPDAALSHFERAFTAIGRYPDALDRLERGRWTDWLLALTDEFAGEQIGGRAYRLYEELCGWEDPTRTISIDDLRAWTKAAINQIGYGGQKRLASEAGIPAPTLSSFRYGKSLPDQYRAGLQDACEHFLSFTEWRAAA